MTPIHVMHVLNGFGYGGAEAGVVKMISAFPDSGVRHSVLSLSQDLSLSSQLPEDTYCRSLCIEEKKRTAFLDFMRIFARERVDIAHVNNLGPWFDVALGSRLAGCKTIETFHGVENPEMFLSGAKKIQARASMWLGDGITAVSQPAALLFSRLTGIPEKQIQVIPNGIDPDLFSPVCQMERKALRERLGLPSDRLLIGCVAAFRKVKNHKGLIRAFATLSKERQDLSLVLIGDGPLLPAMVREGEELGISEQIFFMGKTNEVPHYLKCLDLFVLNSITEGLSYAVLEAMATGLPVIATRVGGNSVLIRNRQNGILVREGAQDEFIASMAELLADESLRQVLGERARQSVISNFSHDRVLNQYAALYHKLTQEKRETGRGQP